MDGLAPDSPGGGLAAMADWVKMDLTVINSPTPGFWHGPVPYGAQMVSIEFVNLPDDWYMPLHIALWTRAEPLYV